MGFLKHLLFWPVTGPMFLTEFSLEKVQGVVKEHLTDDSRVKEQLLDLQLRMELGEVDDDEYVAEETRLMAELREVRRWREEFGMGTRGGVVQMGDAAGEASGPPPGGADAPGGPGDEEPEEPRTVPRGATLEITLDWDDEASGGSAGDDREEDDDEWSAGSSGDSTRGSS